MTAMDMNTLAWRPYGLPGSAAPGRRACQAAAGADGITGAPERAPNARRAISNV
jgi:hypothetical protein